VESVQRHAEPVQKIWNASRVTRDRSRKFGRRRRFRETDPEKLEGLPGSMESLQKIWNASRFFGTDPENLAGVAGSVESIQKIWNGFPVIQNRIQKIRTGSADA
jgi:hypothetical protein